VARLYISAHEDDDLIFMSPCLARDMGSGIGVWTVYLTAGDAGIAYPGYWSGREEGEKAAYRVMGASTWDDIKITVGGKTIAASSSGEGTVKLVFLRLPDGGCLGKRCVPSRALERLWSGERISAIDGSTNYDRVELLGLLAELIKTSNTDLVSSHDPDGYNVGCDHTDHYYAGLAAREAARLAGKPLRLFRGYGTDLLQENVTGDDLALKRASFEAYAAHDPMIAKPLDLTYTTWLTRCYPRPG
jgi:LmbE family N-acetylglucosaminyl deacetylase